MCLSGLRGGGWVSRSARDGGGYGFWYNKLPVVKDAAVATVSTFSIENLVRSSNVTAEDGREG